MAFTYHEAVKMTKGISMASLQTKVRKAEHVFSTVPSNVYEAIRISKLWTLFKKR